MIQGVTNQEYLIIKDILKDYPCKFFAYGSRVKGNYSPLSDLDILVKSDNFVEIISRLKQQFDESYLPYVVNFTDFNSIDNNFYELIKDSLIEI